MQRLFIFFMILPVLSSCQWDKKMAELEHRAGALLELEKTSLHLAKENQLLRLQLADLKAQVTQLKTENEFFQERAPGSSLSAKPKMIYVEVIPPGQTDYVKFKTYQWSAKDLLSAGDLALTKGEDEKASQFYQHMIVYYPKDILIDDSVWFKAGLSSYRAAKNWSWVISSMNELEKVYPQSIYFRSSQLWKGLALLQMKKVKEFVQVVETFRLKYRNSDEWRVLAQYHPDILKKYSPDL
jgi:hypothetical protein